MITTFINYQSQVRGLSPRTCEEYQKNLRYFTLWARPRGLRWSTRWKSDIDCWTADMRTSGLDASTIKTRISTLRTFYDWLVHEGKLEMNPARYCQTPKKEERLPREANPEMVEAWLAKPATTRDERYVHMLTAIIFETGLRISEAMAIKKSDFQRAGIIVRGKGGRERIVFYGHRTIESLRAYAPAGNDIFAGWTQEALRWAMYRTLGTSIEGIHPHQLRHTFAMESLNNGMSLNEVGQLLGHKHLSTTQIYARATTKTLQEHYYQTHN